MRPREGVGAPLVATGYRVRGRPITTDQIHKEFLAIILDNDAKREYAFVLDKVDSSKASIVGNCRTMSDPRGQKL